MRFLFSLILIIVFSSNVYAQDNTALPNKPNIMEVMLFLNANQANNGSASFKADHEKKTLQYFDKEGQLIEEAYIDGNNDIVSKKYTKDGKVISETKITYQSVIGNLQQNENDHEQKVIPELISKLSTLSKAAESYARANNGRFPKQMKDMINSNPPYLTDCPCDFQTPSYMIVCDVNEAGYKFKANSMWPHLESYVMSNGEKLEVIKLQPKFEKSTSTCK